MRALLGWVLALGLVVSPAMAKAGGAAGEDSPAAAKTDKPAASTTAPGTSNAAAATKPASANMESELDELRDVLQSQAKQIQEQSEQLKQQQDKMNALEEELKASGTTRESVAVAPAATTMASAAAVPSYSPAPAAPSLQPVAAPQGAAAVPDSPLQFHIGSAYITPVGFMDFTGVFRNHDEGSGIGTNFAGITYGNGAFQNNLSEFRFSMQNSRIGFRVDAMVKGAHVIGYMESDYLGNNPPNAQVSSNSNTLRSRLFWVDVAKGKWEVLGGQTWSLIAPGRSGINPLPGNIFFTQNIDVNYQAGLVWGRIPELRFVYHPSSKAAFAVALDSPEQYTGGSAGGGTIVYPALLGALGGSQLNTGGSGTGVPNVAPDVIVKLALDPVSKFHVEAGGVERQFKLFNPNTGGTFSATGAGGFVNLNFELFKGFRLLTNNFWSYGGGRYIFGQVPDLIVRADGSPSPIHTGSTVTGFEYTHTNTLLYAYYGGIYVQKSVALDANGTTPIGYGILGQSGQNRAIQEGTVGFNQAFWRDAKYGALNLMGQFSYLNRDPWSIATGQPSDAHVTMVFLNLRYTLPGSAPAIK